MRTTGIALSQCFLLSAAAHAVETNAPHDGATEVVVTGSRAQPRVATESMAPIDVLTGDEITALGIGDLSRALQQLVPSLSFGAAVNAGGAANARGPTLRGLGQDQVLVLVNGKRRHGSALINFNNTIGRGQVPVDLNLIPVSAIERVEVLRDGAAAQYGSDAIAGVINIVLRNDSEGLFALAQTSTTDAGDGETFDLLGRAGVGLGDQGSLTLAAQARKLDPMNRAGVDARFGRITNQQGEDGRNDLSFTANTIAPVSEDWTLYGNAGFARRTSHNTVQYRAPNISPVLFPDGFLPRANLEMNDYAGTAGVRGAWGPWQVDLSDTAGYNRADYTVSDTVNTSLGAASPTHFDAGGARYLQNLVNLDLARKLDVLGGLNFAAGLEQRHENYRLIRGQPESFIGSGSQGFAGFNPPIPVDASRNAWSAYVDAELSLTSRVRLGAAVRYENYEDAEDEPTAKLGFFWQVLDRLALRSVASRGFRAPSLQQSDFSSVTSQSVNGVLQTVGTFAVSDPVAIALGATSLEPETSDNFSVGLVWEPIPQISLSLDTYRIDISDRIVLSETLSGPAVLAILRNAGVTSAQSVRFFTNAVDTRTRGFSITADWRYRLGANALKHTLGYDKSDTDITRLDVNSTVPQLALLGISSIDLLTDAQPRDKLHFLSRWSREAFDVSIDIVRFGTFRYVPVINEQRFGAETIANLTLDWHLDDRFTIGAGVLNLADEYPDLVAERALTQGGSLLYPEAGGLGFEGRQYFARFSTRF